MNIRNFKKGDMITRTERSKNNDGSYMGECMYFNCIENGQIYGIIYDTILQKCDIDLALDYWSEGWEKYVSIDELDHYIILESINISVIERYLRKKKLDKLENK